MPAARARALFSATRTHSLPRVALDSPTHIRHLDARSFRTSSPRRARPDDTNASRGKNELPDKPVADDGSPSKADETQKPNDATPTPTSTTPTPSTDAYKESLRSQGYGSSRVRALRGRTVDEAPPFNPPAWFTRNHVSLLNPRRIAGQEDTEHLLKELSKAELINGSEVEHVIQNFSSGNLERLLERLRPVQTLFQSPLFKRPDGPERSACLELLATARTELAAVGPHNTPSRRLNRPVTVLSPLNYKGHNVAATVIRDIAAELEADVVHLDASSIARIVGGYLGQTPYWSRSSTSMLGYAAAEMNGRLLPRTDSGSDPEDIGNLFISIPSRMRSVTPRKDSFLLGGSSDDRWDDIKIGRVLEQLIEAADIRRKSSTQSPTRKNLIVHIHDYLELNSLAEGIVNKIRSIVDRMWQNGRRAILIGSSSSDIQTAPQWRTLLQMSKEDFHVIPFHMSEKFHDKVKWEKREAIQENLDNISTMIRSLVGNTPSIAFSPDFVDDGVTTTSPAIDLSKGIYDVQWVYRIATLMLGSETSRPPKFDTALLRKALSTMEARDKQWADLYPVHPPYFSPVFTAGNSNDHPFMSMDPEESGDSSSSSTSKNYDSHEKKLLSGLINAKDIRTTFDDIIAPEATKESLIALTSLSLVRPEEFSYGVLKTERIPGCLLYGPPGTGKTLLAKAVAKESGANMLEVSAASINDMYVGQSEKNVRAVFSLARKLSPAVIFLDEADALLGSRHSGHGRAAHRETITQFLREWDGLTDMRAFIMVATNRPFDLDEAVLRRLPRKMLVDLPLRAEREAILRVVLRDEALDDGRAGSGAGVSLSALAAETELYSGSDLKNLCVSAAMHAVREEVHAQRAATASAATAAASAVVAGNVSPADERASSSSSSPDTEKEAGGEAATATASPAKRRVLTRAHFDRALAEISASISDDMESLKAIRKFDEQYGDGGARAGRRSRSRRSMGFEVVPGPGGSEEARVRRAVA